MKVASLSLLALASLVHRADSQCDFCPDGGIQNQDVVVVIPTLPDRPDRTCAELETAAIAGEISELQCPSLTSVSAPVCCVETTLTTPSPIVSLAPTAAPSGAPTAAPSDSTAPTISAGPTATPTAAPSGTPTAAPTISAEPTVTPTGAPTATPTGAPTAAPECYTDLTEILLREVRVFDSTVYREYILCPDTDFLIGIPDEEGQLYTSGSYPIFPRRNVAYKCGVDGKSSNNCRLVSGYFQLFSFDFNGVWQPSQWEPHSNVTISGVTFDSGFFGTVALANPGDITFTDCIFRNHKTIGAIAAFYDRFVNRRRLGEKFEQHSLISTLLSGGDFNQWKKENERTIEEQEQLGRDLQTGNTLDVIINDCLFEANAIEIEQDFAQSAIIAAVYPENRLEIYDSVFQDNLYNQPFVQPLGSAIETYGPLKIENTCFLDNQFLGYAPIVLLRKEAVLTASGNYVNVIGDVDLECDFAISFESLPDFVNRSDFTCFEFDATECLKSTPAPVVTVEPTMAPVRAYRTPLPTPEPSQAPVAATDAPTAGAAGRAIIRLSAAAAALTAYFVFL